MGTDLSQLSTTERELTVNGHKRRVKRRDVQAQIDDITNNCDVDSDTAWEMVVFALEAHLSGQPLPADWHTSWLQINRPALPVEDRPLLLDQSPTDIIEVKATPKPNEPEAPLPTTESGEVKAEANYLPNISTSKRFLPKQLMRTSLFHAGANNSVRRNYKRQQLAVLGGGRFTIEFTGPEFRRVHEMVFMEILKHNRGRRPGEMIAINIYQFAAECYPNRVIGKKDVMLIDQAADELHSGTFHFINPDLDIEFKARILDKYDKDGTTRFIRLDPAASPMYLTYTAFEYHLSQNLTDLAWQVGKYILSLPRDITHIYPIKEESFYEHCYGTIGSQIEHQLKQPGATAMSAKKAVSKKLSHFRKNSLPLLLEELKKAKVISDFMQADGKVSIKKGGDAPLIQADPGSKQEQLPISA